MLAIRTAVCNERWLEAWHDLCQHRRALSRHKRLDRQRHRQEQATERSLPIWLHFLPRPQTPAPLPRVTSCGRPTSHHPWRRRWSPRSPTMTNAKN